MTLVGPFTLHANQLLVLFLPCVLHSLNTLVFNFTSQNMLRITFHSIKFPALYGK